MSARGSRAFRLFLTLALALGGSLILAGRALAQEHPNVARGIAAPSGDLDSVNPFNGNLSIAIPIGQRYPVNSHLSYGLTLVYNSQVWEYEQREDTLIGQTWVQALPSEIWNAGLGFMVSLGRFNPPNHDENPIHNTYLAPDGSRHSFYATLHEGETAVPGVEYTRDGSYLRYQEASRTGGNQQIEFPDGTIHEFEGKGTRLRCATDSATRSRSSTWRAVCRSRRRKPMSGGSPTASARGCRR